VPFISFDKPAIMIKIMLEYLIKYVMLMTKCAIPVVFSLIIFHRQFIAQHNRNQKYYM